MTEAPGPFNAGEPALITDAGGTVSLVEGSTFCLSDGAGDVRSGSMHGFFFRDARMLSRWELSLDGRAPHALSVMTPEAFTARFVLRRPPKAGQADSTLLVVRERLVGDGLRETITLENLGREATAVGLELRVEADFADLFAVKEGRGSSSGADATVAGTELVLRDRADGLRGVAISASGSPVVVPGALSWRVVVPAGGRWSTEIMVQPTLAGRMVEPQFRRGEVAASTGPARKIEAWRSASTSVEVDDPALTAVLKRTESDLGALQIHDPARGGRPFVAAGAPWFMTLFGRDSLLTAWMALPLDVGLALGTLQTLAELQGREVDPFTEEEPGRILHELRLGPDSAHVLGGNHYYGTVDATPLFVMLLAECRRWGAEESTVRALLPAAEAAMRWIDEFSDRDGDGFVEYRRATDRGLINQGWKDSFDGINDARGRLAEGPIALCEVQGYAYAARLAFAELAEAFGEPAKAAAHRERAEELRKRFAETYWLADRGWYAVALDGQKDPVDALTSNAAHCLWSGIATDEHAAVLVERLSGPEMDSGFGLRTLATSMGAYNPMSYHNGSVWPHDTAIAVAGLLRYAHVPGAVELAQRLAEGLLDAATAFGGRLPELFCGFSRAEFNPPVPYPTSCSPQAWAAAAPLLLVRAFLGLQPDVPERRLAVAPHLPGRWGQLRLRQLRLGPVTADITATGGDATVEGLPEGWTRTGTTG
ncbi:MAG TPA: glycogen debranching N-terminal domain-containing protein [Pseudonocardia sp.]|uniref:amylo-alpha-1,6-glucosidase n=1 Tax=Pseudonocardia sp. TaxID=60912 RepID=UPI002B4B6F05|nr:glycogen debranching N-terminal domain-containing protein [Pseudonocardia sp.]HLU54964.1 glycogen debranching N-terminal domain-containing protein [Pseudonocardia sp.]